MLIQDLPVLRWITLMPQSTTISRAEPIEAGRQRGHAWSLSTGFKLTTHGGSMIPKEQVQTLEAVGRANQLPPRDMSLPRHPERTDKRPLPTVHKLKLIQQLSAPWKFPFP